MASYVEVKSGWKAMVRRKGHKAQCKTFSTKKLAEAWVRKVETEIERFEAGLPSKQPSISDIFTRWRDEVAPYRKGERWDTIRINMFLSSWPAHTLATPIDSPQVPQHLRDWRDRRLGEISSGSVNREFSLVSSIFGHAIKEGWVTMPANPISLVKRPKDNQPRKQRCSDAQLLAIVGPLPDRKPETGEDFLPWVAHFAVETAMRLGEICQLTWSDIDVTNKTVHVLDEWTPDNPTAKSVKTNTSRDIPLSKKACDIVNKLSGYFPDDPMEAEIFPVESYYISCLWAKAADDAGHGEIMFRDLRREATTRIAAKVKDVMKLSAITGHKDLKILAGVYYAPDMRELANDLG